MAAHIVQAPAQTAGSGKPSISVVSKSGGNLVVMFNGRKYSYNQVSPAIITRLENGIKDGVDATQLFDGLRWALDADGAWQQGKVVESRRKPSSRVNRLKRLLEGESVKTIISEDASPLEALARLGVVSGSKLVVAAETVKIVSPDTKTVRELSPGDELIVKAITPGEPPVQDAVSVELLGSGETFNVQAEDLSNLVGNLDIDLPGSEDVSLSEAPESEEPEATEVEEPEETEEVEPVEEPVKQ